MSGGGYVLEPNKIFQVKNTYREYQNLKRGPHKYGQINEDFCEIIV